METKVYPKAETGRFRRTQKYWSHLEGARTRSFQWGRERPQRILATLRISAGIIAISDPRLCDEGAQASQIEFVNMPLGMESQEREVDQLNSTYFVEKPRAFMDLDQTKN